jgi:hypothetical protein
MFEGQFFTSKEIGRLLGVSRQRVNNLSRQLAWASPAPGIYFVQDVEPYLIRRGIDVKKLNLITYKEQKS